MDKDKSGSISVEQMREIFRIYKVGDGGRKDRRGLVCILLQVELNMEDIMSKTNSRGKIQRSDFIEYSIEAKLLDLTDVSSSRKTVGSMGRGKEGEERIKKKDNVQVLYLYLMCLGMVFI